VSARADVALCFDVGGTLVQMPRGSLAQELARELGADVEQVRGLLIEFGKRQRTTPAELAARIASGLGSGRQAVIEARLRERCRDMLDPQLIEGAIPCLERLAGEGWPLYFLTNAIGCDVEGRPPLDRFAKEVFASYDIGHCKPAAAAFRAVEQRLGRGTDQLVYIGNSWRTDVEGALDAGWRAIYVGEDAAKRPQHARLRCVAKIELVPAAVEDLVGEGQQSAR
jgi:FMN phosphatase YigB (HAD superfamily)